MLSQLSYTPTVGVALILKHLPSFRKSNPPLSTITVSELCQNPCDGDLLAQPVRDFVGLAIEFFQGFSFHLGVFLEHLESGRHWAVWLEGVGQMDLILVIRAIFLACSLVAFEFLVRAAVAKRQKRMPYFNKWGEITPLLPCQKMRCKPPEKRRVQLPNNRMNSKVLALLTCRI